MSLLSLNLLDVLLVLIVYCDVIVNTQTSLTLCLHSPQDVCWCLLWSLLMVSNRGFFICYQYKKNWFGTIFKPIYTCWSHNLLCTQSCITVVVYAEYCWLVGDTLLLNQNTLACAEAVPFKTIFLEFDPFIKPRCQLENYQLYMRKQKVWKMCEPSQLIVKSGLHHNSCFTL